MDKEKLIKSIMADAEKDGEPLTRAEAEEVAEMELKANGIKRYERAEAPKERKPRERKIDQEKQSLLILCSIGLDEREDIKVEFENESRFNFQYNGNSYTVTLTKHRPQK